MNVPPRVRIDWRRPGGRKPHGVVVCSRPGRWGNPWRVEEYRWDYGRKAGYRVVGEEGQPVRGSESADKARAVANCLWLYRAYLEEMARLEPGLLEPLRTATGLACYCDLGEPCHVDVIRAILAALTPSAAPSPASAG